MPPSEGPYQVGQEVEVSYRARVAEVVPGHASGMPPLLRLEALGSHDYSSPPGGWLSPAKVNVKIMSMPLPTTAGLYRMVDPRVTQEDMGEFHTDGYQFYYLNTEGRWIDIGYGVPYKDDAEKLEGPLVNEDQLT